ncbi:ornithine cyclodeaminase family protein [Jiella marina]|uniref:ornithine cyclodeaminase family protein n=1 Tax=Jiella sp. LLJ827 TaxID=2917712 RepID=UPI002100E46A|nr:ornithine cyclodeaminase [Jiella sp. LLJ827]MCQ0988886.1 ornithine cyclodeaminase [Jiella sp. LLJ827]
MKIIGFEEGDRLLTWPDVAEAIRAGHQGEKAEIGDLLIGVGEKRMLNRAAWIPGLGIAMKSVTVFPDNPKQNPPRPSVQGGVLVFDAETGVPTALIDGGLVTKWKTAGDSILGATLLANPEPKTLLICGAGTVADNLADAYPAIFPSIDTILVWNRTQEKAEDFVARHGGGRREIRSVADLKSAVGEADIVTTATMAVEPIIKGDWLQAGTHLDLIGAYRPDMREADDAVLRRGELFVDSRETTIGHIGEIQIPLDQGTINVADIRGDFADLVAGRAGRSGPDAITVFKNGGGAHLDLMVADLVLGKAATES